MSGGVGVGLDLISSSVMPVNALECASVPHTTLINVGDKQLMSLSCSDFEGLNARGPDEGQTGVCSCRDSSSQVTVAAVVIVFTHTHTHTCVHSRCHSVHKETKL